MNNILNVLSINHHNGFRGLNFYANLCAVYFMVLFSPFWIWTACENLDSVFEQKFQNDRTGCSFCSGSK